MSDHRLATLRAALGFLQLAPRAPELRLLHRRLGTWCGIGLIVVGVERQGFRLSLSHIADHEWRATFAGHPMFAPGGYGVASTPWRAVQQAAWATFSSATERSFVEWRPRLSEQSNAFETSSGYGDNSSPNSIGPASSLA